MSNLVKVFNNHLMEFIADLESIFPDNVDIKTGHTFISGIKKVNPKKLIQVWKTSILDCYGKEIESGDIEFFLNKDYRNDLPSDSIDNFVSIIEDSRVLLKNTSEDNKKKSMKYLQNLTKICNLYYTNN